MDEELLERMLPRVVEWAETFSRRILTSPESLPLTPTQLKVARSVGVKRPEAVRIQIGTTTPFPPDPALSVAARTFGILCNDRTVHLVLGDAIWLRANTGEKPEELARALVHVAQAERLGGLAEFVSAFLRQCNQFGIAGAPLEIESAQMAARLLGAQPDAQEEPR